MKRLKKYVGCTLIIISALGTIFGGIGFLFLKPIIDMILAFLSDYIFLEQVLISGLCKVIIAFPLSIWLAHRLITLGIILIESVQD